MLDQFKIPPELEVRVPANLVRLCVEEIFEALGMSTEDARQSADVLIFADLHGIDSHGVSNMLRVYVERVGTGEINPTPNWRIVSDAKAACTIDSDGAHGGVIGPAAMQIAIERAKEFGVGSVTVYNGGHFGAAAYHAAMALEHDMIGLAMTAGGVQMVPTFGAEPILGLNPIGFAAPAGDEPPFIFDASMSSVAGNKIRLAKRLDRGTLPGWIAGGDGDPIMEPGPIPDDFKILPLGGTREVGSHKGMGLAMMVEILTSVLSGGGAGPDRRQRQAHHFVAYRIDAFTDSALFKSDLGQYLRKIRGSKPAPGHERVYYPGLPEHEEALARGEAGIPYHPEVIAWFREAAESLGIEDRLAKLNAGNTRTGGPGS